MGVNVLLFLIFQWALEPWRRGRLVRGFEEKVKAVLESEKEKDRERAVMSEDTVLAGRHDVKTEAPQVEPMVGDGVTQLPDSSIINPSSIPASSMEVTDIPIPDTANATANATAESDLPTSVERSPLHSSASLSTLLDSPRYAVQHLFSTNLISIRQIDLTSARIEGAMVGIAFASIIAAIVRAAR